MAKKAATSNKSTTKSSLKATTKVKTRTSSSISKNFISKAPVRRLMKEEGASLVSDEALDVMIAALEKHAVATTKKALEFVKDDRRKRLTAEDISFVIK